MSRKNSCCLYNSSSSSKYESQQQRDQQQLKREQQQLPSSPSTTGKTVRFQRYSDLGETTNNNNNGSKSLMGVGEAITKKTLSSWRKCEVKPSHTNSDKKIFKKKISNKEIAVESSDDSSNKENNALNIIFDSIKMEPRNGRNVKRTTSDLSNDDNSNSVVESGYKSYNSIKTSGPGEGPGEIRSCSPPKNVECGRSEVDALSSNGGSSTGQPSTYAQQHALKGCMSDVCPIPQNRRTCLGSGDESSERISQLIVDIFGCNSKIGKFILDKCSSNTERPNGGMYEEFQRCVKAELEMEDKLLNFFKRGDNNKNIVESKPEPKLAEGFATRNSDQLLVNLDESLSFVKENLASIRSDLSDFKENCWQRIETKVSRVEFSENNAMLKSKVQHLERKLFNEHRLMRQDLRNLRDRMQDIGNGNNELPCGLKNFPFWPFVVFLGAYSLISFGNNRPPAFA